VGRLTAEGAACAAGSRTGLALFPSPAGLLLALVVSTAVCTAGLFAERERRVAGLQARLVACAIETGASDPLDLARRCGCRTARDTTRGGAFAPSFGEPVGLSATPRPPQALGLTRVRVGGGGAADARAGGPGSSARPVEYYALSQGFWLPEVRVVVGVETGVSAIWVGTPYRYPEALLTLLLGPGLGLLLIAALELGRGVVVRPARAPASSE